MTDACNINDHIRVAVVGAGRMGRHHARNYSQISGYRLVAVCDADMIKAQRLADEFQCAAFASVRDMLLSEIHVDAASIAVPTLHHRRVAEELLTRRIHVLVEKPLAQSLEDARAITDAAQRHGCVLQVGHSERFNPVVRALDKYKLLPQFVEVHRISPMTFRSIDVGVVLDMMIHDIDIVHHFVQSDVHSVAAVGIPVLGKCEDVANARVVFTNGCVANFTASRLALKTERRMRLFSPEVYVSVDYQKKSGVVIQRRANATELDKLRARILAEDIADLADLNYSELVKYEELQVDDREPLRVELESFLNVISTGDEPEVNGADGCFAVDVAARIIESMAEHHCRMDAYQKLLGQEESKRF